MRATRRPVAISDANGGQLLRILDRERAQAHSVEQLEDGSVRANAERKGKLRPLRNQGLSRSRRR